MVTVTIKDNTKQAKAIIALLKTFSFVEVHENKAVKTRYNKETERVITEARKGKGLYSVRNSKELFQKLGI